MKKYFYLLIFFCTLVLLSACGGGNTSPAGSSTTTSQAIISFSLVSTATLPFRMTGFELTAALPSGVSVSKNGTTMISSTSLAAGSALTANPGQVAVSGSFIAPNIKISYVGDQQAGFGPGEIARLTCLLGDGVAINENARLALENEVNSTFLASGWDPGASTNPTSLKPLLKAKVDISISN